MHPVPQNKAHVELVVQNLIGVILTYSTVASKHDSLALRWNILN
jgi:hypothetical protein